MILSYLRYPKYAFVDDINVGTGYYTLPKSHLYGPIDTLDRLADLCLAPILIQFVILPHYHDDKICISITRVIDVDVLDSLIYESGYKLDACDVLYIKFRMLASRGMLNGIKDTTCTNPKLIAKAFIVAAKYGHLHVLWYMYTYFRVGRAAMCHALYNSVKKGHNKVAEFIIESYNPNEFIRAAVMKGAAIPSGNLVAAKMLTAGGCIDVPQMCSLAKSYGRPKMIKYINSLQ